MHLAKSFRIQSNSKAWSSRLFAWSCTMDADQQHCATLADKQGPLCTYNSLQRVVVEDDRAQRRQPSQVQSAGKGAEAQVEHLHSITGQLAKSHTHSWQVDK